MPRKRNSFFLIAFEFCLRRNSGLVVYVFTTDMAAVSQLQYNFTRGNLFHQSSQFCMTHRFFLVSRKRKSPLWETPSDSPSFCIPIFPPSTLMRCHEFETAPIVSHLVVKFEYREAHNKYSWVSLLRNEIEYDGSNGRGLAISIPKCRSCLGVGDFARGLHLLFAY